MYRSRSTDGGIVRKVDDGRIEIDNSAAVRAFRGVALGRRNDVFAGGGDSGGARAASMVTLIGTAKLNTVEPEAYLRYSRTLLSIHQRDRRAAAVERGNAAARYRLF